MDLSAPNLELDSYVRRCKIGFPGWVAGHKMGAAHCWRRRRESGPLVDMGTAGGTGQPLV